MKSIPDSQKFTIADNDSYPADFHCPNPRGWYHSVANVADTPEGLVAVYRLSDSHTAVYTHIMAAYSKDGGKTWGGSPLDFPPQRLGTSSRLGRTAVEPPQRWAAGHHLRPCPPDFP